MIITDYHMRDCANLDNVTANELHETDVWAGYIGGAVEKVWTDADWRRVDAFPKAPIYGARTNKTGNFCGLEALLAIAKLEIPKHTTIIVDMEVFFPEGYTSEDLDNAKIFLTDFTKVMTHFEYGVWKYGSTDYLFELPSVGGAWVATDNHIPEQYPHSGVHATQYLFETNWDESLIHRHAVHKSLAVHWGINNIV